MSEDYQYESESDIEESEEDIDPEEIDVDEEEVEPGTFIDEEEETGEEEPEDDDLENLEDVDIDENEINISDNHKFEIVSVDKTYERLLNKKRIGGPMMTIYELTKLIGIRSQQIASGMPPLIEVDPDIRDTKYIAIKELLAKKMPLIVRRYYPNGYYEDWRVEELIVPKNILF